MPNVGAYAKAIAAIIGSGLGVAITFYPSTAWIRIAIAICTALAVVSVANTPKAP